jgi:taspase (threonine aspartase 1)
MWDYELTDSSAAKMAMSILKNGDSAVAAVEAAIRVLEDKEITNAGYGSNLTIEGVVECDATIVDHLGRSGACGATASMCFYSRITFYHYSVKNLAYYN